MSETGTLPWLCPACGRRVPARIATCHCGMTRGQAALSTRATPGGATMPHLRRGRPSAADLWRSFPTEVKVLASASALVLVVGLGWTAFGPRAPEPALPLLGRLDTAPPPLPKPPQPPFKLPWWR